MAKIILTLTTGLKTFHKEYKVECMRYSCAFTNRNVMLEWICDDKQYVIIRRDGPILMLFEDGIFVGDILDYEVW